MKSRTVIASFSRWPEFDRKVKYRFCICWRCQECGAFFYTEPSGPPGICPWDVST